MIIQQRNTDQTEIFAAHSQDWWDENGPFKPLHMLNPHRISYTLQQAKDVKGKTVLDVGCGGGLVCEPLARLGARVTGIDLTKEAIAAAKDHARAEGLDIQYFCQDLATIEQGFDLVLALEVIEHVANPDEFVSNILARVNPGGVAIFSTLNRTKKSLVLGKYAAEYILGWVPKGTHDWRRFVKPSQLASWVERNKEAEIKDICGLSYNPLRKAFSLTPYACDINYFLTVSKGK